MIVPVCLCKVMVGDLVNIFHFFLLICLPSELVHIYMVAVKSNQGLLKHHNVQNKEDVADLYQSSLQKNTVRGSNIDMIVTTTPKDFHCFHLDVEPSTWHICYPDRISNESQHADDVLRNDHKLGHKQMRSPEGDSYQWLEDVPSQLEDCDLLGANPTVWKNRRTECMFHGHAYSGNFGMLEDVRTKGLLSDDQDSEIIGPEIELQEPCFGVLNRPNRIMIDFVQNQTNVKTNTSGCDGFYVEFDKSNEDCLHNEVTETIADISRPEMSHFSGGPYHEDCSTSRGFCSVMKKCSTREKLGTAARYVEGLEANTIAQMNFPDIQAVWESDYMDGSSIEDSFLHFPHPYLLADTPRNRSHARTDLELHGISNNSSDYWNCENIDSDFRFSLDRFNSDSSIICEGTKRFNNFDNETQPPNYFNHKDFSVGQFISEDGQKPRKSKIDARLSYNIPPEKSVTGCHLGVPSSQMANDNMLIEDLPNQHNFGCRWRSRLSKGRSRSHSAPPFYRGKRKFPRLNEPLTRLTAEGDKDIFIKDPEGSSSHSLCHPF